MNAGIYALPPDNYYYLLYILIIIIIITILRRVSSSSPGLSETLDSPASAMNAGITGIGHIMLL